MRNIFTTKFIKYFLFGFLMFLVILLSQFIGKYTDDIFGKGFPTTSILKLIWYTSLSFIGISLLFGTLIAAIFAFRYHSIKQNFAFKKVLLNSSLIVIGISLLFLAFNNWILPKSNLEMRVLLYQMKTTAAGENIEAIDKNLFLNNHSMMTIQNINRKIDTFNIEIDRYRKQCDSILGLLPGSLARESYSRMRLEDYGIQYRFAHDDTITDLESRYSINYLRDFHNHLKQTSELKQKFIKEKTTRIVQAIEMFLLFIIGASFGFFYNDQKAFLLIILGLYTMSFFYGTIIEFEQLISQDSISSNAGTSTSILILVIVTSIFLVKAIGKEQQTNNVNLE